MVMHQVFLMDWVDFGALVGVLMVNDIIKTTLPPVVHDDLQGWGWPGACWWDLMFMSFIQFILLHLLTYIGGEGRERNYPNNLIQCGQSDCRNLNIFVRDETVGSIVSY